MTLSATDPKSLRKQLFMYDVPVHRVAKILNKHQSNVSAMLCGRIPMRDEIRAKIEAIISEAQKQQTAAAN